MKADNRISFTGDIMCEEPLQKACLKKGKYDFSSVFDGCREIFSESGTVIGNLETVFAGEKKGFTKDLFSFNTPDEFAFELSKSGINIVSTATNHSLDRDIDGLNRTLEILDKYGIGHLGTYLSEDERNVVFSKTVNGKKIGFLNYTYGTNTYESPYYLADDELYRLNLIAPQKKIARNNENIKSRLIHSVTDNMSSKTYYRILKAAGKNRKNVYTDELKSDSTDASYIERIKEDVKKAKDENDIVFVLLHIGGQFNEEPGEFVKYFVDLFSDCGVDCIICNHPHIVQKCEYVGKTFVAYSLGNFNISPSSVYVPHKFKPEYSVLLHFDIDENGEIKKSFSVLKIVEDKSGNISVVPADELYGSVCENEKEVLKNDIMFICNRFCGKIERDFSVKRFYLL